MTANTGVNPSHVDELHIISKTLRPLQLHQEHPTAVKSRLRLRVSVSQESLFRL